MRRTIPEPISLAPEALIKEASAGAGRTPANRRINMHMCCGDPRMDSFTTGTLQRTDLPPGPTDVPTFARGPPDVARGPQVALPPLRTVGRARLQSPCLLYSVRRRIRTNAGRITNSRTNPETLAKGHSYFSSLRSTSPALLCSKYLSQYNPATLTLL